MKRLLLILFKLMFVSLFIKAQTYAGRVTDKGGQPLVSASVVAKTNGGSVVAFARAGQDGRFSLIIPQGKVTPSSRLGALMAWSSMTVVSSPTGAMRRSSVSTPPST